jgi:tetratricopeptide (TPR) repeat protein
LALAALDRPREAASAIGRASTLEPNNAVNRYLVARYRAQPQRSDATADAWHDAVHALQRARTGARTDAGGMAPFERVGLLRQSSGVAPIFLQSRYSAAMPAIRTGDYATVVATLADAVAGDPIVVSPVTVRARLADGAAMLRSGRLESALEQLLAARDEWPDQPEIHRLIGLIYRIDEQPGKSIDYLRKAMTLAPGDERARVMLVDVLMDERRLSEAERELKDASATSGQIAYRLWQLYQRQSLLPQAIAALQESERVGPVIGADYFYQAWAGLLVNQADFDRAISIHVRRVDANPNSAEAHRQLGEILILQGRDDEALAEFLVAAWLDPKDARAHAAAGQVYARMMKYPEAIDALMRALALDPRLREARYTLGTVLMRAGKVDEGKAELEMFGAQQADAEAQGRREFEIDALRRQAASRAREGDVAAALAGFERAAALDPQSSRSHRDLGVALLRAKRSREAVKELEAAQQIEASEEGFVYLADAYAAVGNTEEAARQRGQREEFVGRRKIGRVRDMAGR